MKDSLSPEEKLLRLIRGTHKHPARPPLPSGSTGGNSADSIRVASGSGKLPAPFNRFFSFANARNIITLLFIVSALYLIFTFIQPLITSPADEDGAVAPEALTEPVNEPTSNVKPFQSYIEAMGSRQIFSLAESSQRSKPSAGVNVDILKDINLVGVISGDPSQAIIEDKKQQKTYYLSKDQYIGEIRIEDIQEGKVILEHKGQRYELHL